MATDSPVPRYNESLSDYLGDLRSWVFSSQTKAAQFFHVTHSTVSRYEAGHLRPSVAYLACLTQLVGERLLNTSPDVGPARKLLVADVNKAVRHYYPDQPLLRTWEELSQLANGYLPPLAASQLGEAAATAHIEWGEAPDVGGFCGRTAELARLGKWIGTDGCRLVVLLGMGGVGKTALAAKLVEQAQNQFECIVWRSLRNAPPIGEIVRAYVQVLSNQVETEYADSFDHDLLWLLHHLQQHHCLLVLDNVESIMREEQPVGQYRPGYEQYGEFFRAIAESRHQSCLVLTTREKPDGLDLLEDERGTQRVLRLTGIYADEGARLLQQKNLHGSQPVLEALVTRYSGNPMALKLVAETIREVFGGDVLKFLEDEQMVFTGVRRLLDQQADRLAPLEWEILYWLAVEREPVMLDELQRDLIRAPTRAALIEAVQSLRRRSLLEKSGSGLYLQNVVLEYATDRLQTRVFEELMADRIDLLQQVALIKAEAKDYIRQTQVRLILAPLAHQLQLSLGRRALEAKSKRLLALLRAEESLAPGYGGGNMLNMLLQLGADPRDYDFSNLTVWQAYLRDTTLHSVNFSHADLARSVFSHSFVGVNAVALSPNGQLLAIATGNEVRIWNVATSQLLAILAEHSGPVWTIAFAADGNRLASGSADRTVRWWDVSGGRLLCTYHGHNHWVWSVAISADGQLIASGGEDQSVRLWSTRETHALGVLYEHDAPVRSVAISPDGSLLASGSADHTVRLWDMQKACERTVLRGHTQDVLSVAFSADGAAVASGSADRTVCIWDTRTGELSHTLRGHTDSVCAVAFDASGDVVASGSYDQMLCLWSLSAHQAHRILHGHQQVVRSISFNADGDRLASGSYDQTARVWDVRSGQTVRALTGHTFEVKTVAFSPDGGQLASGGTDHVVRLWHTQSGQLLHSLPGHTRWVSSVAYSPDGHRLASASYDRTVRLWDVQRGQLIRQVAKHDGWVWCVGFSHDGMQLATGSADRAVRLLDAQCGEVMRVLRGHAYGVWTVVFSPSGKRMASADEDGQVLLWECETGRLLQVFTDHASLITALAFSADGQQLIGGARDSSVRLWDLRTGQAELLLPGHGPGATALAFSLDGQIMASSGADRTIQLWQVRSGQALPLLLQPDEAIASLAFAPGGKVLAGGSNYGAITLWDVSSGRTEQVMRIERPYEQMNIFEARGLTDAQRASLKALGAVERPD